ncbi:hypothetical protein [Micromonospora sp. DT62]|uniref:hypothetical protein n=1 Tax=Micromonospora sp. DT62 TaxID=3416521 RepID=UPI003CF98B75
MTRTTLINLADILTATAALTACPDCAGGLGIVVDHDGPDAGAWEATVVHSVPCPTTKATTADYRQAFPTDEPTPGDDPNPDPAGDAVAILAALHRGDQQGAADVLATINPATLIGPLLATVAQLGPAAVGADAWIEALSQWQPGQHIGDGLGR